MKLTSISHQELLDSNTLVRGLAILTVVVCHIPYAHAFWKPLWVFASAGKLAVSLFLFSSGLLLQAQVNRAGGTLDVGVWLKKRFWRIYPIYWVGLAVTVFCAWGFRQKIYGGATLAANMLGIPLLLRQKAVTAGYTAPFWFISLLLLCYGLFLLTHRFRRKGILLLGALALSFVALYTGGLMTAAVLAFPAFFMGMWMADRLMQRGEVPSAVWPHAAAFLLFLALLVFIYKVRYFLHWDAQYSLGFSMLGCVCLTVISWPALYVGAYFQKMLARWAPSLLRGLLWISGLSFALYCIHEPFLLILDKCTAAGHPWWGLLGYVVVTLAAAWGLSAMGKRVKRI